MALPNPYQQYRQQQVNTATPDKLLIMLYDGAIRFCSQAKIAIESRNLEQAHVNLTKAQNIIIEFMTTLNMDYEISRNLYSLYDYLYNRLVEANMKKDTAIIDELIGFLTDLRKTWAEAATKLKAENGPLTGGVSLEG
ncbi:MAG: flagellar export chaperone FliS [Bacillota bacterium]|uniref:Flagellar secretion chaperone FliS n=1 Tax=Thermanaerosceptrum fracticalcis TaxID=1712410 RepID=A0A7G6E494_THEFR|nr:flagellar export chaperone FliS [Thermanaerosceptrum fracticalcis]QNB46898.1 flagellar export chaperone FliS [Thermanaerosceptrum fracticalcis]